MTTRKQISQDLREIDSNNTNRAGWIEVICGPMFSGKTEELIRRLRRARFARQSVEIFKPSVDDRYARHEVVSHSSQRVEAVPLPSASSVLEVVDPDTKVVGIDEVQFFEDEVLEIADALAAEGRRVVLAGLDTDYTGRPFEPVPALMARAEYVTKLLAICVRCGSPANRTLRLDSGTTRVEVGARERYEAVCRTCHHGARAETAGERSAPLRLWAIDTHEGQYCLVSPRGVLFPFSRGTLYTEIEGLLFEINRSLQRQETYPRDKPE